MHRPRTLTACLAVLNFCVVEPCLLADSWATFRGPKGTGQAIESLPDGDGPLAFELQWKKPLGSGYSGISIQDDTLVTAFTDGDRDYVVALDPSTGAERWRYDLAPKHVGHDGSHDGPISTPAIADGKVFALSPAGLLAAVDLESGASLWTVNLVDDLGCEKPFYDFGSSPLVVGETMVLQIGGEAGSVAGFDVATGDIRWRALEDQIGAQSPILTELGGRPQILVQGVNLIAGLDPTDGTVLWQLEHEGGPGISLFSSPTPLNGDRVFLQNKGDTTSIIGLKQEDSRLVPAVLQSSRGMAKSYSPPTRSGNYVFGYTARFLSAIDSTSGELLWRSREPGDGFSVTIGDQLVVLAKTGSLHLGLTNPEGWQESLRLDLFEDLAWTPPSYADGAIYARSLGEIARINLVRTPQLVADAAELELPAALEDLAAEITTAEDTEEVLDRFFEGRELPLVNGEEVVFMWRGEAKDLAIAGDMIGMRREEPMHKMQGTDLWWWSTKMDTRARASYLFYVDYTPTTDPTHDRTTASTILGPDMNWRRDEGVEMSWFAMPEWPGLNLAQLDFADKPASKGRVDFFDLVLQPTAPEGSEPPEPSSVSIPVWVPPGYDETDDRYPAVYVTNSTAREIGNWPQALDKIAGRTATPIIAVFLELRGVGGQDEILPQQIVPAIDKNYRTIADREHRGLIGMGWPGLGAMLTAFEYSDLFGVIGVQSFFALDEQMAMLNGVIGDRDASTLPLQIYLEWGRWDLISPHEEMNFRTSSRKVWDLLREKGWEPMGGEVWDSTDWGSWHNRTDVMLETLFPLAGTESNLAAWQTAAP